MSKQHRIAGATVLLLATLIAAPVFADQTFHDARNERGSTLHQPGDGHDEATVSAHCPMMNPQTGAAASVQQKEPKIGFDWSKVPAEERARYKELYSGG
jgi:hypothetical protein